MDKKKIIKFTAHNNHIPNTAKIETKNAVSSLKQNAIHTLVLPFGKYCCR